MAHETILIVDDERDITELIRYNLEKENFKTITVATGEDALSEAKRVRPDLIILDLMLPGVDGLEVCRKLSQDEATRTIPILMLTAKSEDSDIILGLEMGADDYVTKPFSPKVLIARIRALLRRNREKEALKRETVIRIHGITIDTTRHEVLCDNSPLPSQFPSFQFWSSSRKTPAGSFPEIRSSGL
jgi:two-component system phosphate regulon response regulator PhoB